MNENINKIVQIIESYRSEDVDNLFEKIDYKHIEKWVNQFDEEDREFIIQELLHLLPNSFFHKSRCLKIFDSAFDIISKHYGFENAQDFLKVTKFLDCQDDGKSQKELIKLMNDTIKQKYNIEIKECGTQEIKFWCYIDDILASGGTFEHNISNEIKKYGIEKFKESSIIIISLFFIIHQWGVDNKKFKLSQDLGIESERVLKFYSIAKIENNPRINWFNNNPKFNFIYPLYNKTGNDFLIELEENKKYPLSKGSFAFRNPNYPKKEIFFSNPENRIRYENILLKKGLEIIDSIDNIHADSLRPLGMTNPSYKTLGTGTHFFTWRNISNTCPLVFWWDTNGWTPLFPRKH